MSLAYPPDTLAYHSARVLTTYRDMRSVPIGRVMSRLIHFLQSKSGGATATPESEALWFYGLNHVTALLGQMYDPLEPILPKHLPLIDRYHKEIGPRAVRAFYYLLYICTREARHMNASTKPEVYQLIQKQCGSGANEWFKNQKMGGEAGVWEKLLKEPPPSTIGQFCRALQIVFYHGSFAGGYGGPKWGSVADCLFKFVTGEYSAEVMLDTVWTLCHNNGPIFNKGLFYVYHNANALARILDIQRSGQVPEAILSDKTTRVYAAAELTNFMVGASILISGKIGTQVDWLKVESLGSVHKYPLEIKMQLSAVTGAEPFTKDTTPELIAMGDPFTELTLDAEPHPTPETHFEISPGLYIPIYAREKEDA